MYEAARVGDGIVHNNAMAGFLIGAVIGVALVATVTFCTATCGFGVALLAGLAADFGASAIRSLGESIGASILSKTGVIANGSPNVFINGRPAAYAQLSSATCAKDPPQQVVAVGSSNVFINSLPAARLDDSITCGAKIAEGSGNVFIGDRTRYINAKGEILAWDNLNCSELADEKRKCEQAQVKFALADATYQDPNKQYLPDGWSRVATDADWKTLGLIDEKRGNLTKPQTGSNFRADVFKGPDGKYVVAFRGIKDSFEDWKNGVRQEFGYQSEYYDWALEIGERMNANQPGNVEYVGLSAGGGMATFVAYKYGSPATTFNAAGPHAETLRRAGVVPNFNNIDAYYVEGEILSGLQDYSLGLLPTAAGERIPLSPADPVARTDLKGAPGGVADVAVAVAEAVAEPVARGIRLHYPTAVKDALAKRLEDIDWLRRKRGCV